MKVKDVEIIERGWPDHFCLAKYCLFRRNTLLVKSDTRIVVSTVGKLIYRGELKTIGCDRYYETIVWFADDTKYQNADVMRGEIAFYPIQSEDPKDELPANTFHDSVVEDFIERISNGETFTTGWEQFINNPEL